MKSLAKSIQVLAGQLIRLKEVPILDQLHSTMREFPNLMEEVVIFIWRWLESWMCTYPSGWIWDWWIGSSQAHLCWLSNGESNCVEEKTWHFQKWNWLTSSYRYPNARSGFCAWYSLSNLTYLWLVSASMAKNIGTATDKELDHLVSTLRDHRLRLRKPCMAGTHTGILQEFNQIYQDIWDLVFFFFI